jgi:hypothetical protein
LLCYSSITDIPKSLHFELYIVFKFPKEISGTGVTEMETLDYGLAVNEELTEV